jgi:hypothetical protein
MFGGKVALGKSTVPLMGNLLELQMLVLGSEGHRVATFCRKTRGAWFSGKNSLEKV